MGIGKKWSNFYQAQKDIYSDTKYSYEILSTLAERYRALGDSDKKVVRKIIIASLLSEEVEERFDALWLVEQLRFQDAVSNLVELSKRLERKIDIHSLAELEKVKGIINRMISM